MGIFFIGPPIGPAKIGSCLGPALWAGVAAQALSTYRAGLALSTIDRASGCARAVLFRIVLCAADRARPIWNPVTRPSCRVNIVVCPNFEPPCRDLAVPPLFFGSVVTVSHVPSNTLTPRARVDCVAACRPGVAVCAHEQPWPSAYVREGQAFPFFLFRRLLTQRRASHVVRCASESVVVSRVSFAGVRTRSCCRAERTLAQKPSLWP
jgi:hypothetical protein